MRNVRATVLAGVALALVAGTAVAAGKDTKTVNVALPDGSVAHVEYTGNVAPKVTIQPLSQSIPIRFLDPFDAAPFEMFDRISTAMDRQFDTVMQQVHAGASLPQANGGAPAFAAFGKLPEGVTSYSFVSTSDGRSVCNRSWQMTSNGQATPAKVTYASSGDCSGAVAKPDGPIQAKAAAPEAKPRTMT